jgi:hypothetical protein
VHHFNKLLPGATVFALAGTLAFAGTAQAATRPADDPPSFSVDVSGVGLPSRIALTSDAATVTSFDYVVAGGHPTTVPARNGAGAGKIFFPAAGSIEVTAHAYAGKKLIGESTESVDVSDVPGVVSDEFLNPDVTPIVGSSGTFTFTPHACGVVAYYWWFNDAGAQEVRAAADGTATVSWTPPAVGKYELFVESVTVGGTVSSWYNDIIAVHDPRPMIQPDTGEHSVGRPVNVALTSNVIGSTGFVYSFDGGPQQPVAGTAATVQVTPTHAGASLFTAQTVLAGGTLSAVNSITIDATDAPQVSVAGPYGEKQPVATEPATFTFTPSVPNVVSYQYTVDGDGPHLVAAGPDGTASVTFTPDYAQHSLSVSSVDADGVVSDARDYEYTSLSPSIYVYGDFGGGVGVQGIFTVLDDLTPVIVAYHWSVDGGSDQVTAVPPDSDTFAELDYKPAHSGTSTLLIQAEYNDGTLSPVTTYTFEVG